MSTVLHITVDEYDRMVLRGAFDELRERRIELVRGELREISPQGRPHNRIISYLARWSIQNTAATEVEVSIQGPIRIPALDSEPEPDVVWTTVLTEERHAEPHEVLLLIEVAHTSQEFDLGEKALIYAQAGIVDYWVVDVPGQMVHVLREPSVTGYRQQQVVPLGQVIHPLRFPHLALATAELFAR